MELNHRLKFLFHPFFSWFVVVIFIRSHSMLWNRGIESVDNARHHRLYFLCLCLMVETFLCDIWNALYEWSWATRIYYMKEKTVHCYKLCRKSILFGELRIYCINCVRFLHVLPYKWQCVSVFELWVWETLVNVLLTWYRTDSSDVICSLLRFSSAQLILD